MSNNKPIQRLGDLLLDANLIDEIQLRVALQEQAHSGERLGSALVHLGFIDEAVLAAFLSKQADLPCVNIHGLHIPPELTRLIPKELAVGRSVIPVRISGDVLYLAMADPFDFIALEQAAEATGLTVVPLIAPEFRLKKTIERCYDENFVPEVKDEKITAELSHLIDEMEAESLDALVMKVDFLTERVEHLIGLVDDLRKKLPS